MKEIDIYGTIGPACAKEEILKKMFIFGMTGIRVNLSHVMLEECEEWIQIIKKSAAQAGIIPKILMDLQGPELRIGNLIRPILLVEGKIVSLRKNPLPVYQVNKETIPLPPIIFDYLKKRQLILLDDSKIQLEIVDKEEDFASCKVIRGGMLQSRKSIAMPEINLHLPVLTENDKKNIHMAKYYGITGVMLPFVRQAEDLKYLKQELQDADVDDIEIFAKIENLEGIKNLKELILYSDQIVIARGDLGNQMPLWELPAVQADIARQCQQVGKPYMVVTQMLASMEKHAIPTRAEVSDIFRAVIEGASSVMVTGETAIGKYPVEVIQYLANTVKSANYYRLSHLPLAPQGSTNPLEETGSPIS